MAGAVLIRVLLGDFLFCFLDNLIEYFLLSKNPLKQVTLNALSANTNLKYFDFRFYR